MNVPEDHNVGRVRQGAAIRFELRDHSELRCAAGPLVDELELGLEQLGDKLWQAPKRLEEFSSLHEPLPPHLALELMSMSEPHALATRAEITRLGENR
jgi:hypothetical protein